MIFDSNLVQPDILVIILTIGIIAFISFITSVIVEIKKWFKERKLKNKN